MKFTYIQAPLNRYTFSVKKIKNWVEENIEGRVLNLFCGKTKLDCDEVRNDLDSEMPANFHKDALIFVQDWSDSKFNTILLDPPYSYRKSMEMYKGHITSPFNQLKNELINLISPGGVVITFGYHSISMGRNRNFNQEHILLISHGGAIHDTIATIERFYQ